MARPLRIEFSGAVYHITSRGNAKADIFLDRPDYTTFLTVLADTIERFNWICHSYCLMTNHYHLLIETPEGNLSQGMRHLNSVYSQRFNRRNSRVGHVLQGRYKSILVDRDSYLLQLCRYIVLNPVRANKVKNPDNYIWSNYRATAGLDKIPDFLTTDWILQQFDKTAAKAQLEYRRFVLEGMQIESPLNELKGQCLLGSKAFLEKMVPMLVGAEKALNHQ